MVTLDPPAFVTVSDRDWLLPRVMLPKLRVVGFDPSAPAVTPVPVRGLVRVGLEALEVMVTLPVTRPPDVGLNTTLKVALWPAASVVGAVMPLRVKPVPLIAT